MLELAAVKYSSDAAVEYSPAGSVGAGSGPSAVVTV